MKPTNFKQAIKVLQRPNKMTDEECGSLPVWSDGKQCVSVWKASFSERIKILFTGKVYCGVISGGTQPPIFLSGENVFVEPSIKDHISMFFAICKESITCVFESATKRLKSAKN